MEDFSPDVSKSLTWTARTIFRRILVWKSTRCISFFFFFLLTFIDSHSEINHGNFGINRDINNSIVSFINATIQRGLKDEHCSVRGTSGYVNSGEEKPLFERRRCLRNNKREGVRYRVSRETLRGYFIAWTG